MTLQRDQISEDSFTLEGDSRYTLLSITEDATNADPPTIINVEEDVIAELKAAGDDIALVVGGFGAKIAAILQWRSVKDALLAEPPMLSLPCLREFDSFRCVQTKKFDKPTQLPGEKPMLYWLYDHLLDYLQPSATAKGVRLQLTPTKQSGQFPPRMDIELLSKNATSYIQLTVYHDGPYNKYEVLSAPINELRNRPTMRYGKPVPDSMDVVAESFQEGITAVLDYLVPRHESRWRIAMCSFPQEEEERFLTALVGACRAPDDAYFVSDAQENKCRNLFARFPEEARNFLQGRIGKRGGPFSQQAFAPSEKD